MKMNDLVIISVDDHIIEPADVFDKHLSGNDLATAPKMRRTESGANYWEYQGLKIPLTGLNAVMGRVPEEYGMEPTSLEQVRKGCYDPKARVDDMNVNGIASSLNFPTAVVMDGYVFLQAPDKVLSLKHLRAYNDWHIDEWCGAFPGRFIPCGLLPTWDMDAAVAEIKRIAAKGCKTVSINENPTKRNLPSIHNAYWEPFWKALADNNITISLHIGAGNPAPHASMETPIEAWITTMPMSVAVGLADWLNLEALQRYPLKICIAEGGAGWVPALIERADYVYSHHQPWTHSDFGGAKPSEVFRKHFMVCFIDDAYGLKNLKEVGEENVAYECDYPHSDSTWPRAPEKLWEKLKDLPEYQIENVTHRNAMRFFNFDPFAYHSRKELTVGALRAKAAADKVDTTPKSYGGAKPLAEGVKRRVTSGDIMKMNVSMAKAAEGAKTA